MQRTLATRFNVVGPVEQSRGDDLGDLHDPVSVCPAVFGFCALASLSLLFDLNGLLRRATNLFLQVVVVIRKVLA